jgi:hypothetical protein
VVQAEPGAVAGWRAGATGAGVGRGDGTRRSKVISEGAPKRFGGPQYPVPRLV